MARVCCGDALNRLKCSSEANHGGGPLLFRATFDIAVKPEVMLS